MDKLPKEWKILTLQKLLDNNTILSHLDGNHGELYPKGEEFVDNGVGINPKNKASLTLLCSPPQAEGREPVSEGYVRTALFKLLV